MKALCLKKEGIIIIQMQVSITVALKTELYIFHM